MALGSTNITTAAVNTELGSPFTTPRDVSDLTRYASQNQFSFRGPWHVTPDASKNCTINYGTSNDRLGDFRLYNHSALTPKPATSFTVYYYPGESTKDVVIPAYPYEMNILDALSGYSTTSLYLCYKLYSNSSRTTLVTTKYSLLTWSSVSLTDHIRNVAYQANSTQSPTLTGITTSYSILYGDCYISDVSGTRLLNLGTSATSGYFTLSFTLLGNPYIDQSGTVPSGSSMTGAHTAMHSTSTKCSEADVTMTYGSTSYYFYIRVLGYISSLSIQATSSTTIQLIHYNYLGSIRQTLTVATGTSLYNTAGRYFSGTLANSWAYGDYAKVNITTTSWGSTATC